MVRLAQQVERYVLERRTYALYLVVLLVGQRFSRQLLLADAQQEAHLLADALRGLLHLLGHHVVLIQQVGSVVEQLDGLLPERHVRLNIALHHGVGRSAATTLGTHRLLGVEDGVVLQLGPRAEGGVQVLEVPAVADHEVGHALFFLVDGLHRLHPLCGETLLPVDFAHALLHLLQHRLEVLPLLALLYQDLLGGTHAHGGHEVETLRRGALGGVSVVVNHLLQHLGIGLVSLRHQANLVVARALELRAYARLRVTYFVQGFGQVGHARCAGQQLALQQSALPDLLLHLQNREVVGQSHHVGQQQVHHVVVLLGHLVLLQGVGYHHGLLHLVGILQAEGHRLQPHHAAEVALQRLVARVVATGAEQAVGE